MEAAPTVKRRGMRGVMMRGLVHKERMRSVWNSQCKRVAPRGLDSRALSTNTTSVPGIWVRCGLARHGQWSIISKVVDSSSRRLVWECSTGTLGKDRANYYGGDNNNCLNSGYIEENRRVWACLKTQEPQEPAESAQQRCNGGRGF